jgi:hypothetical protein
VYGKRKGGGEKDVHVEVRKEGEKNKNARGDRKERLK